MLSCAESIVELRGITQKGKFELINHNQNLAVVFEVISTSSIPLEVEPRRGIIMQQQHKKIKVWVDDEYKERALGMDWTNQSLIINCTMKTQYNRKMFEQLQMRGWSKVKDQIQQMKIPIKLSTDALNIRSQIESQATNSLSQGFFSRGAFSNQSNEMRSMSRKKISKKLDKQLDYLFQLENRYNLKESLPSKFSLDREIRRNSPKNELRKSKPLKTSQIKEFIRLDNELQSKIPSARSLNSPRKPTNTRPPQISEQQNSQRVIQLIILAALAGFCAALGSNLKQIFL